MRVALRGCARIVNEHCSMSNNLSVITKSKCGLVVKKLALSKENKRLFMIQ